ncbi:hypothetical protein HCH04_15130 [Bacteroides thetaiotaomicron]|uniref:hypothetical protein n=1 Tax=Bacteroides thetaiotaomicron TaxID=818 RepID=UPI001C8B0C53|nr:hypothetical protein [Bacteroides thetaiotaomicron]MBX9049645.1 hypothetical protein [Bacteroides thetaiotaomicron]MBX9072929.1 hypothetical protein [Bacteroides thetaiotaomicron]
MQLFPNIVWQLFPPQNDVLATFDSPVKILNTLEWTFGVLTIFILVLIVNITYDKRENRNKRFLLPCGALMAVYYIGFSAYLCGFANVWWIFFTMVITPPIYFGVLAVWQKNIWGFVSSVIFLMLHAEVVLTVIM